MSTSNRDYRKHEKTVKQSRFKHLGELHKEWTEAGVSESRVTLFSLCFLKSTVYAVIYQDILEHFMLPSADKLYGDADFIFQQDLALAHTLWPLKLSFSPCIRAI